MDELSLPSESVEDIRVRTIILNPNDDDDQHIDEIIDYMGRMLCMLDKITMIHSLNVNINTDLNRPNALKNGGFASVHIKEKKQFNIFLQEPKKIY